MIHYLLQSSADHPGLAEGVPPEGLLSAAERERFESLGTAKRRRDWLLGRWTAKRLLQTTLRQQGCDLPLDALEIRAAPDGAPEVVLAHAADGAPEVFVGQRATQHSALSTQHSALSTQYSLSISHSRGRALCALSVGGGLAVGCDIELVELRSPGFARDYFTEDERALLAGAPAEQRDTLVTTIWSAKEAALKALRLGLTVDTRAVTCLPELVPLAAGGAGGSQGGSAHQPCGEGVWHPIAITTDPALLDRPDPCLRGWWRVAGDFALTLASITSSQEGPGVRAAAPNRAGGLEGCALQ
ncbi:MAG: hypothetical protein RLZZ387_2357 [Chloroflexota bacterium]